MKTLDELLERLRVRFDDGTDPHLWGVYMDMIKSAAAREREAVTDRNHPGNAAALREALIEIDRVVWDKKRHTKEETEAHRLATEALTVPARQCDVGTAEDQAERFVKHCQSFLNRDGIKACVGCPCCGVVMYGKCELAWAQMPYTAEE